MPWNTSKPSDSVPADVALIERSLLRSFELHRLDPGRGEPPRVLTTTALKDHREPMERFMRIARGGMEALFGQVRDAGYVVLLADTHGVAVDFIGNPLFDQDWRRAGLWLGSCWTEEKEGTCAVALANLEQRAITVHHAEHFRAPNKTLTCSAVPIFAPDGRPLAVLDASAMESPDDRRSQHLVLQMVQSAARMAEDANFLHEFEHHHVLKLARRRDFLEVSADGMVVLDETGRIVAISQSLREQGALVAALGRSVEEVFDYRFEQVADAARQGGYPLAMRHLPTGTQCFALVRPPRRRPSAAPAQASSAMAGADALQAIAGHDPQMQTNVRQALRVLDKGLAILLHGESGSGKEAFAKAMHEASARRARPFVAVNCAAIPETLIESELFGYREGAFTGARTKGARGKIAQAHGGTLFLDEIGDMPQAMQTRLLRVLAEREVTPLGAEQPVAVDVQLICATHRDLRGMVAQGQFRLDLYYRLNSVTLELPALRDRADKGLLIERLLREDGQQLYGRAVAITEAARQLLLRHDWPGNIRQLKNVLRTAMALSGGEAVGPEHLPAEIRGGQPAMLPPERMLSLGGVDAETAVPGAPGGRDALLQALKAHQWNVTETARSLGLCRATVYRHMQRWEIVSPNRLGH
ncbi:sigma-54-dependent Fis family transcriptional regulator [Alicycliphilus denitrificans]|uniref:Sigma54 specific transcriptional regulator with PAS/PAC sensor, Fis family n=2 Tax=Alicycliphilus denitrificans TaxID=179636 RepID=F4GDZ1_ALIDK|nr:sigma-54-dependent Fis family transcriptional regulator [Alicycliphilus denitrificans]ADV00068.1 sigma-54 factor interaction domain-containing protein [Alicycliphilus denitrificans BC]AEB84885.1 sigma54 specific transcriptional regulator with PAS/PAC sensor, Fis family [Alicycliphilus denitrificans K601]QKD44132.1 sigma-54-dependent Fis family transcriptional regulator [Alicycliphilus denitrificans]GAO23232.1 Fis family sigma-54 specific transcriptional regulator [Alicycliphilus sp. B1]